VNSSEVEHQQQHEEMVRRSTASIPGSFMKTSQPERGNPYFFYGSFASNGMVISSGQSSPSDTLDSGTCSDLDGSTPPPLPKKKSVTATTATVTVTVNGGGHRRTGSLTSSGAEVDSDDEDNDEEEEEDDDDGSNISCDSLNSSELNGDSSIVDDTRQDIKQIHEAGKVKISQERMTMENKLKLPTPPSSLSSNVPPVEHSFPQGLLQDIRDRTAKLNIVPTHCSTITRKTRTWADELSSKSKQHTELNNGRDVNNIKSNGSVFKYQDISPASTLSTSSDDQSKRSIVEEKTYEERQKETVEKHQAPSSNTFKNCEMFDTDRFYKFHLNEHVTNSNGSVQDKDIENEETFAGYRDLLQGKESSSTIRSAKGTVRGVKNRVRAGIATFLQLHDTKVGHGFCVY
jgi:glutaredoxin domain-containing cysteine-rich protein 1